MEIRNLGRSGLKVSLVGLGCNNFGGRADVEASRKVLRKALDLGITLFDTADTYGNRGGSETIMGDFLGSERKNIVLASKFGWQMDDAGVLKGGSRRYILQAVHDSLKRLKTDHLDLYQFHRPDPETPIEETLRTMNDLLHQGMVRYIGCSNMPAWQVADAQWTAKSLGLEGFISCQDEYSLLVRKPEAELLPAMQRYGLGLLPYFPLASGLLTGKSVFVDGEVVGKAGDGRFVRPWDTHPRSRRSRSAEWVAAYRSASSPPSRREAAMPNPLPERLKKYRTGIPWVNRERDS
jgi:aryl-alcohol dehydrogenase-like predicted oxidoreductase